MYAYSNNGQNIRAIEPGMEVPGEVVFDHLLSAEELEAAFPGWDAGVRAAEAKAQTMAQVQTLEASQARTIREAILTGDATRLKNIERRVAQLMGRDPVVP